MTAYCAALLAGITTALLSLLKLPEQRHHCARVSKLVIAHEYTSQVTYLNLFICTHLAVKDDYLIMTGKYKVKGVSTE